MFEQTFKNIDDVLWKDEGCDSELDYAEQTACILFLKYLDDLETERGAEAKLAGKKARPILDAPYRWSSWAAPKTKSGEFDHDAALTGDDLIEFVNDKLFPYLQSFKQRAGDADTIEYKIGAVFSDVKICAEEPQRGCLPFDPPLCATACRAEADRGDPRRGV